MPSSARTAFPLLTLRELNRALLARQMLLEREKLNVVEAIEELACLQGQWAPSPYVALWSRLAGFKREQLTAAIDRGAVVKTTIMRATLHLVSAREYPAYHLATLDGRFGAWRPPGAPDLKQLAGLHAKVLRFASATPRTRTEIQEFVAKESPSKDERMRNWLVFVAITSGNGLLWDPAGAHFEHRKLSRYVAPPAALRRPVPEEAAYDLVLRRHLGAFGPATLQDIANWSSARMPHLRAALARAKGVVRFTDERGRELYDLARAPRPDPETTAPARFLARFDAAILGHVASERTRILPEAYRRQVIFSAEVWTTFLVDGFVAGRWSIGATKKQAILELKPFKKLARAEKAALVDEGERLVRFYYPDTPSHGVTA
jgi:hypothetical protein